MKRFLSSGVRPLALLCALACERPTKVTPSDAVPVGAPAAQEPGAAPVEVSLTLSSIELCFVGLTDSAASSFAAGFGLHHPTYQLYRSSGDAVGSIAADPQRAAKSPAVVGTLQGYSTLTGTGSDSPTGQGTFAAYTAEGSLLSAGQDLVGRPFALTSDGMGGSTVLSATGPPPGLGTDAYYLELLTPDGRERAAVALEHRPLAAASNSRGHTLVLAADNLARWFDKDGAALTDWFSASPGSLFLTPLADDSIASSTAFEWIESFPDAAPAATVVPEWLRTRPAATVTVVRGGTANAVVPTDRSRASTCGGGGTLEVISASGDLLQRVSFPSPPGCLQLSVDPNGTVSLLSIALSGDATSQVCSWRWWPLYLD